MAEKKQSWSGALLVLGLAGAAAWNHFVQVPRQKLADRSKQCETAAYQELAKLGKKGLVHYVGYYWIGKGAEDQDRYFLNIFVGDPPKDPPLDRDSFYNASAICTVDKYGVGEVALRNGSSAQNGVDIIQ